MNDANDFENKINEYNPSIFEKIFLRIIQPIALSLAVSVFSGYLILQLPYNLNLTAIIIGIIVFFAVFRFFYKKLKNDRWAHQPVMTKDYDAGNTNDPRNPSSYGTPGSPYYAYDVFERNRSHENKSAFSDSDNYYHR